MITTEQDRVIRRSLQESGETRRLTQVVRSRIVSVLDTAGGRRNRGNLWGVRPATHRTLYFYDEAALSDRPSLFISGLPLVPKTWVAGREFRFKPSLGEELVREVVGEFGDVRPGSVAERIVVPEEQGSFEERWDACERLIEEWSAKSSDIKFVRTARRLQRYYGSFPPEAQKIWWEVKLANPK